MFVNTCKHERTRYSGRYPNGSPIWEHCVDCAAVRKANDRYDRWHTCASCIDVAYVARQRGGPTPA